MSKKSMFKKTLAVSTAVVLSSTLLNFGPVSYKVFDKPAAIVHASEVDEVKVLIQSVFNELNGETELKTAYDAAILESQTALSATNVQGNSTYLASKVSNPETVKVALKKVLSEGIELSKNTTDVTNIPASLSAAVSELNTALGTSITASDVASFLLTAQEEAISQLQANPFASLNLLGTLIESIKSEIDSEWNLNTSNVVKEIKNVYGSDQAALNGIKGDLTLLKNALIAQADTAVLEKGGMALALSYIKHKISTTPSSIAATQEGNTYTITAITVEGIPVPLNLLEWNSTVGTASYNKTDFKVALDVTSVARPVTATLTGKLKNSFGFTEVTLVTKTVVFEAETVTPPVTSGPPAGPAGTVLNPPADTVTIELNSEITKDNIQSNVDQQKALADINRQLAEYFVADLTELSTEVGQLTIVNLSLANLSKNFFSTYESIIKNAKEKALEATGSDKIKPVITFNLDSNNDSKLNIDADIIKEMKNAGLYAFKLSTNGASVEIPLADLDARVSVTLTSAAAESNLNLSDVQSKVYSIEVSESGKAISHSAQQYKVLIPVADGADISKLTVAKLVNGSITYIGGKYDATTKSIELYTNEPGSFVAAEHNVSFADADRYDWAVDAIQQGAVHGILLGKTNNEFKPEDSVTRAEFLAVLLRSLNLSASDQAVSSLTFTDVPSNAWYHSYVAAAKAYGITNGRSPQQFDPNATITREEMASLVANAMKNVLGFDASFNSANQFDQDGALISPSHSQNVGLIANEGIMQGTAAGKFDPKKDVSRAEAIVAALRVRDLR